MSEAKSGRRLFLLSAGGGIAVLAIGGTLYAAQAPPGRLPSGDAYAPWTTWDDPSLKGTPFALVAAAVLAANPHDTQPWLFRVADDAIEVYADASRNLGAMDPYLREMHLGLGCAVKNMTLSGPPNGYAVRVEAVPGALTDLVQRDRPVLAATLRLSKEQPGAADPLYRAIPERHTNHYSYDRSRLLDPEWMEFRPSSRRRRRRARDSPRRRRRARPAGSGRDRRDPGDHRRRAHDRRQRPLVPNIPSRNRRAQGRPDARGGGLSFLALTYARFFPVSAKTSHDAWLSQTRDTQVGSAPVLGLIAVRDRYDRAQTIAAGRCWQRLHLDATPNGVALQPVNQPVEMIDRERQLGQVGEFARRITALTGSDSQATFSFRAGKCSRSGVSSLRRRLADALLV